MAGNNCIFECEKEIQLVLFILFLVTLIHQIKPKLTFTDKCEKYSLAPNAWLYMSTNKSKSKLKSKGVGYSLSSLT